MARTIIAWLAVAPWAVWAVARVLGLERGFPFVQLMAYTPYVVPLAVGAALIALVLRRRLPAVVAVATVAVLAVLLAPRAIGDDASAGGQQLRVLTANAYRGNVPAEALLELVRRERVDVLAVQELSPQLAHDLDGLFEYRVADSGHRGGSGVYSRLPLEQLPSFQGARSEMAAAQVAPAGAPPVQVISVHVAVPLRGSDLPKWRHDLEGLPASAPNGPIGLLAGDFNSTLDHAELRELVARGYRDAAEATGAGLAPTWQGNRAPPVTIDHILVPERLGIRDVSVHDLPRSDHEAVVATVELPAG